MMYIPTMNSPKANKKPAKTDASRQTLRVVSPMHKANRQMSIHLNGSLDELGLSGAECHMLAFIDVYKPCPIGELVRVFGHKRSTTTSILDRLVDRGFLVREVNPKDRRSFLVKTTAKGSALAETAGRPVQAFDLEVVARVTERDMVGFEKVLRAIEEVTGVDVRKNGDSSD